VGQIVVQFKSESDSGPGGEEVGPVFVFDEDDPDTFLEDVRTMTRSEAERLARERGYDFTDEA
jgi:hypothetical protein